MGLNIGVNAITTGVLFISTLFLLLMGILLVTAHSKVEEIETFLADDELQSIAGRLRAAYIIIFIAGALSLILMIAYVGHESWWNPSEWVHTAIFVITIILLILGLVLAYTAMNRLNVPTYQDEKNSADSYVWGSLLLGLFTFIVLIAAGSGRVGFNAMRSQAGKRILHAEEKVHQIHDSVVKGLNPYHPDERVHTVQTVHTAPPRQVVERVEAVPTVERIETVQNIPTATRVVRVDSPIPISRASRL